MEEIVLMPAYMPDKKMINAVCELWEAGLSVLIVDDGSGSVYDPVFEAVVSKAEVIRFRENRGKGATLKSGIAAIRERHPECKYFITADADGQHRIHDILRVRDELRSGASFVLSVRRLKGDIPTTSKMGNGLSRVVYTFMAGHYFTDNQSGLRGFSADNAEWLLKVPGERYDYELCMLYYADKQGLTITTITIDTVYIDNNKSSHFDPLWDTLRLYKRLFASAWVSFLSAAVCEVLILILSVLSGHRFMLVGVMLAGAASLMINLLLNKYAAFYSVNYRDGGRLTAFTIIRFIVYSLGCAALRLLPLHLPLFWEFNIIAAIAAAPEYFIHKWLHGFKHREIVKENG